MDIQRERERLAAEIVAVADKAETVFSRTNDASLGQIGIFLRTFAIAVTQEKEAALMNLSAFAEVLEEAFQRKEREEERSSKPEENGDGPSPSGSVGD